CQKTSKVRPSNQSAFASIRTGAFIAACNTMLTEFGGNITGTFDAAFTDIAYPFKQRLIIRINIQTKDMQRTVSPSDGNLNAVYECDAQLLGGFSCLAKPTNSIMVG